MKHPDEGMVHAWLDGALDDADARDIDAHAAQCAECAAMVAEARGLIAASSRIVRQLDGVPPRVVAPVVARGVVAARGPRAWWRSPGLAAAALFCVTTTVWVTVRTPATPRELPAPAFAPTPPSPPVAVAPAAPPMRASRATREESNTAPITVTTTVAATTVAEARKLLPDAKVADGNVVSADTRADAAPASASVSPAAAAPSNTIAPAAFIACYSLTPTSAPAPEAAMALAPPQASQARARSVAAMGSPAPFAPVAPAATPTMRLSSASEATVTHFPGVASSEPVTWDVAAPGLVRLTLPDGRRVPIRIGADTAGTVVAADRAAYTAKRTACP